MSLLKSFALAMALYGLAALAVLLCNPVKEVFTANPSITSSDFRELNKFRFNCKGHTIISGQTMPLTIECLEK